MPSLPVDLKNYRSPRSPWGWIIGIAVVVAFGTIIGPLDYAWQLDLQAENTVLRAQLAAKPRQSELAPIRPRRCGGEPYVVRQPDGGKWSSSCAPEADLTRRRQ